MIKYTTWHPDTCKCVVTYSWDDAVPADERVHTFTDVKPCAVHAATPDATGRGVAGTVGIAVAVHAENVRKNQAIATVVEHRPDVQPQDVAWRIDEARRVHLSVPAVALDPGARALPADHGLQQALDARFGPGVVILD
jgi:hypothetical protein